jgi:hypothetical protein
MDEEQVRAALKLLEGENERIARSRSFQLVRSCFRNDRGFGGCSVAQIE